MQIPILSRYCW